MCLFKVIRKSTNGFLLFCKYSNKFQLSYKNILIDLSTFEFLQFVNYLKNINCQYWEQEYVNSIYEKKIPIPTLQSNFIILLNRKELEELRFLVDCVSEDRILKPVEINYLIVSN